MTFLNSADLSNGPLLLKLKSPEHVELLELINTKTKHENSDENELVTLSIIYHKFILYKENQVADTH